MSNYIICFSFLWKDIAAEAAGSEFTRFHIHRPGIQSTFGYNLNSSLRLFTDL